MGTSGALTRPARPTRTAQKETDGMPKPNYAFEKRQRDLAKKKKKEDKAEEKRLRKSTGLPAAADGADAAEAGAEGEGVGKADSAEAAAGEALQQPPAA